MCIRIKLQLLGLTAEFFLAGFAVNYFFVASGSLTGGKNDALFHCLTGGVSLGRNLFNSGKYFVANAALGSGGVTLFGTGRFFCGNINSGMHMPDAAVLIVVYGRSGFHSGSLKICTVRVAQLRGGNCDFMRSNTFTTLRILICNFLCAQIGILYILARTVGTDIGASCGRVHSTVYSKRTVYSYFCIHEVAIATVIRLTRRILYRHELTGTRIISCNPFISVIYIYTVACRNDQFSALGNGGFNSREQCCSLIYRQLAAGCDIHRHIVGKGQNIVLRAYV